MKWSTLNGISQSKAVKSVAIWFILVPALAKLFSAVESNQTFSLFGAALTVNLSLPFQWTLLFYASCFFLLSSVLYSLFCPEFIKNYANYSDFKSKQQSRTQLHSYFADIIKPFARNKLSNKNLGILTSYLENYAKLKDKEEIKLKEDWGKAISQIEGREYRSDSLGDEFYYVRNKAETKNYWLVWITLFSYVSGFICLTIIVFQNINYVFQQWGVPEIF